jgi:hypothetical protein
VLTGADKHWSMAEEGHLYRLIVQGEFANPVVVLDELDKADWTGQYRPANALHALLEAETARNLRDKCVELTFDASYTVYIATASALSSIDPSAGVTVRTVLCRSTWTTRIGLDRPGGEQAGVGRFVIEAARGGSDGRSDPAAGAAQQCSSTLTASGWQ